MIHWCSAEGRALLLLIIFFCFFLFFVFWVPFFSSKGAYDIAIAFALICSCRLTAKGSRYRVPYSPHFSSTPSCSSTSSSNPFLDEPVAPSSDALQPKGVLCGPSRSALPTRVAIVTGASSGVGYAVAEALALSGEWIVIMTGPNLQRVLAARRKIQELLKQQKGAEIYQGSARFGNVPNVVVLEAMDLSDERSVRNFASKILENEEKLPVSLLVHAAGVLNRKVSFSKLNTRWWSVEKMLATNAVGPMLLSLLLVPTLQRSAKQTGSASRIIHVASSCHTFLSWLSPLHGCVGAPFSSMFRRQRRGPLHMIAELCMGRAKQLQRSPPDGVVGALVHASSLSPFEFSPEERNTSKLFPRTSFSVFPPLQFVMYYGLSKLCVLWNSHYLARLLERQYSESNGRSGKVLVCCTHPGISCTHLYRDILPSWVLDNVCYYPSLLIAKTQQEAAYSTLRAIHEDQDSFVNGGYYLCDGEHSQRRQHYWPMLPFLTNTWDTGNDHFEKTKCHCCLSANARNEEEIHRYVQWLSTLIPEVQL